MRLQNRLEGWWPLIDEAGSATDYSKNSLDGILNGNPVRGSTGILADSAYDFDGSGDYIEVGDEPSLEPANLTVSAWIYPDAANDFHPIVADRDSNLAYQITYLGSGTSNDGKIRFIGASSSVESLTDVQLNTWQHIVVTYDNNFIRFYLDGVGDGEFSDTAGLSYGADTFRIAVDTPGENNYFAGKLADIRVYSRALPPAEVNALYERGRSASYSSIKKSP